MNKKIKQDYQKKIDELKKHNKFYYENSSPVISDSEYDKLKKQIIDLEKKHNFLKSNFSPSTVIAFTYSLSSEFTSSPILLKLISFGFFKDSIANSQLFIRKEILGICLNLKMF